MRPHIYGNGATRCKTKSAYFYSRAFRFTTHYPTLQMSRSGSGKRSRGCPLCDPTNAMPANAGTHSGHLGTFSAAGRRLLIFVGSSYRPLLRMGELTQACQLIPKHFFFSTVHGAFSFWCFKKKMGGAFRQAKPASLRRFAAHMRIKLVRNLILINK